MENKIILTAILLTTTAYSDLKYVKMGTETGVGYRFHKDSHGYDLSVNYSPILDETTMSGKVLYLYYPTNHLYLGAGVGIVHGRLNHGPHASRTYPSLETAFGYEFVTKKKVTFFTQLELSIPYQSEFLPLYLHKPGESWRPGITIGMGF